MFFVAVSAMLRLHMILDVVDCTLPAYFCDRVDCPRRDGDVLRILFKNSPDYSCIRQSCALTRHLHSTEGMPSEATCAAVVRVTCAPIGVTDLAAHSRTECSLHFVTPWFSSIINVWSLKNIPRFRPTSEC